MSIDYRYAFYDKIERLAKAGIEVRFYRPSIPDALAIELCKDKLYIQRLIADVEREREFLPGISLYTELCDAAEKLIKSAIPELKHI